MSSPSTPGPPPTTSTAPNLIATVESFLSPSISITSPSTSADPSVPSLHLISASTLNKLKNLGTARVKDARALGHSRQVISHIPVVTSPQTCSKLNDSLHAGIRLHGDKFRGLALLPCGRGEGKEAAAELVRCIIKLRFVGGMVISSAKGVTEGGLEELWEAAARYRVPIAMREVWPAVADLPTYQSTFHESILSPLTTHLHNSHTTSPLPLLHLYLANTFDHHPSLRLILAHPGSLPSLLPRIETLLKCISPAHKPKRSFLDVWQHNIYVTTADVQDLSAMRCLLEQSPLDRVLYASNYPLEERGRELMDQLRESGFLEDEEWEGLAFGNAETLFGVMAPGGRRRSVM